MCLLGLRGFTDFFFQTSWLKASGQQTAFETFHNDELASALRTFYGSLRKQDGSHYSRSSYINIRAAINRHLQSPLHSWQINIAQDRTFISANNVVIGLLKDLKAWGMDQTTHKAAISAADMQKMYSSGVLSDDNPKSLQRKVFIKLMLHFSRRGREGLKTMRRDSVVIKTDASGTKYTTMAYNELIKNHQSVTKDKSYEKQQPMMVAQANRCPIKSLELYMSKLNEQCDAFWQRRMWSVKVASRTQTGQLA